MVYGLWFRVLVRKQAHARAARCRRRRLFARVLRCWCVEVVRATRERMEEEVVDLRAAAEREKQVSAQLREAEEMLAEAYAAQGKVEEAVREEGARGQREVAAVQDLLKVSQMEEERLKARLDECEKARREACNREQVCVLGLVWFKV
jgi:hypothetical protein